jgi:hypothetical protein
MALQSLLDTGTALAPLLVAFFVGVAYTNSSVLPVEITILPFLLTKLGRARHAHSSAGV